MGAYKRCLALPTNTTIIGKAVIDTGSVRSMTATKAGRRVVPIPLHLQPLIEGAGGGTIRATHWVFRGLPAAISTLLPVGAPNEVRFLHGPAFRFDITATDDLSALGVSTVVCADSGKVHLFPKGGDYRLPDQRVTCDTVEGLWTVPGDWCHTTPLVALPHLRPRSSTRSNKHRRRPGHTSDLAAAAISARAGTHRRRRRHAGAHTNATAAGPTDDVEHHDEPKPDQVDDHEPNSVVSAAVETTGWIPEPDLIAGQLSSDVVAADLATVPGSEPATEAQPEPGAEPEADAIAVHSEPSSEVEHPVADPEPNVDPEATDATRRSSRTMPGAGRAARAARTQLTDTRLRRQLQDAASDGPPRSSTPQLTPIDYGEARLLLGNPSHRDTVTMLQRAGRRPIHVERDRPHLDELRAHAGQMAQAMTHVPPTGLERTGGEVTWADTLGGKWRRSKAGNQFCITWSFKSRPYQSHVSFSDNHEAASTWAGFRQVCRQAGMSVLERAVSQDIQLVTDQGTEFLGVFAANIKAAGIQHVTSTAYKTKKHGAQAGELVNRNLQRFVRGGLMAARANFAASGHDGRDYWDYGAQWAARSMATRRRALDTTTADTTGSTHAAGTTSAPLSWQQIVRRNIAPFGARGFITIQAKDPKRSTPHQLADCAKTGLFLGLTDNGKSRMLLPTGEAHVTSDVTFPIGAMAPTSGPVAFHDTEAWLATVDASENDLINSSKSIARVEFENSSEPPTGAPTGDITGLPPPAPDATTGGSPSTPSPQDAAAPASSDNAEPGTTAGAPDFFADNSDYRDVNSNVDCELQDGKTTPLQSATPSAHRDTPAPIIAHDNTNDASRVPAVGSANAGTTDPGIPHAVADTDGNAACHPSEASFSDDAGVQIRVGDEVSVARITGSIGSHRQTTHRGTVQAMSKDDEQHYVECPDGTAQWHPSSPGKRMPVLRRALIGRSLDRDTHRPHDRHTTTLIARRPEPSEAVRFAVGPDGNIKRGCWDGTLTLPPEPPMPPVRPEDTPPCPETVFQALAHEYAMHWLHSAVRERRGHLMPINRPPTHHFTRQRPHGRRLMTKWVFTTKRHPDDSIDKFKARECIAGWHLRRGTDYTESYSGMTPWSDVLDLESLAALLGLDVWEADLKQAYAFAAMPPTPSGTPVIAMSCPGAQVFAEDGALLHQQADQAWHGHPSAGCALAKHLHGALTGINPPAGIEVCPVPFVQNPFQPCMFKAKYPIDHTRHGEMFTLHVSTDNLRTCGSDASIQADFMSWLRRQFEVTGGESSLRDQSPKKFMGCIFSYDPDGSVTIDMPLYVDELLNEVGMRNANPVATPMAKGFVVSLQDSPTTPDAQRAVIEYANTAFGTSYSQCADIMSFYGHLVSSIGWITHRVGPIMQHAHSVLCRVLSAPSIPGFQGVKRLLRCLAGKVDMHRTCRPDRIYDWRNGDLPTWSIASDASYADDPHDRRGQGGYVGGYDGQAATTTMSKKTRRTCTAVDQAESDFAGSACKEAEYKRHWMGFFDILKPGPTTLTVDNFATFSRAGAPTRKWSPSSKQHDVNEKYLTECRERDVIRVEHSRGTLPEDPRHGEGFPPDAMTKALPRLPTEFYYDALHGRRTSPVGARAVVDNRSLCTTMSDVHSQRSIFSGLVQVQYDDGTRYHVSPGRIAFYKGEQ